MYGFTDREVIQGFVKAHTACDNCPLKREHDVRGNLRRVCLAQIIMNQMEVPNAQDPIAKEIATTNPHTGKREKVPINCQKGFGRR